MPELNPPEFRSHAAAPLPNDNSAAPPKRQRRPSVRLGDIGDDQQLYESNLLNRRPKQPQWNTKSSSKNRPLLNLIANSITKPQWNRPLLNLIANSITNDRLQVLDSQDNGKYNNNSGAVGSWKKLNNSSKSKRGGAATKRVRSNWRASSSKTDEDDKFSGGDDDDEIGFRDFDGDDVSDSGLKEQSQIHCRRDVRVRVSHGVELDGPPDTDSRTWNNNLGGNGVRVWLNQLGLGCYTPVFEIHEVDDEVLPQLTLEDLKDMGINAVGSRRKMYSSIQKLGTELK